MFPSLAGPAPSDQETSSPGHTASQDNQVIILILILILILIIVLLLVLILIPIFITILTFILIHGKEAREGGD